MQQLIAAPHPNVTAAQVVTAMQAAFAIDPTGGGQFTDWIIPGVTPAPGSNSSKVGFLSDCAKYGLLEADYEARCQWLIYALWRDYINNGFDEFWEAALAVYDYAVHIPAMQATRMNAWLLQMAATP